MKISFIVFLFLLTASFLQALPGLGDGDPSSLPGEEKQQEQQQAANNQRARLDGSGEVNDPKNNSSLEARGTLGESSSGATGPSEIAATPNVDGDAQESFTLAVPRSDLPVEQVISLEEKLRLENDYQRAYNEAHQNVTALLQQFKKK